MSESEQSREHPFSLWLGEGTPVYFSRSRFASAWTVREGCEFSATGCVEKGRGVSGWQVDQVRGRNGQILYRDRKTKALRRGNRVFLLNSMIGSELSESRAKQQSQQPLTDKLSGF